MKFSTTTLSVLLAVSMLGATSLQAKTHSKTVEKVFAKSKKDANNPLYKIKLNSIRELTDEEALEYELDVASSHDKSLNSMPNFVKSNSIKIPNGIPGVEGISDNTAAPTNTNSVASVNKGNNNNHAGDLAVGTGAGGTVSTGTGAGTVNSKLDGVLMIVDKLVAIGEKIIPTIEKGRPAVTNKPMQAISVIPRIDAQDPVVHEMGDWSIPVTKHYKIDYSNGVGGAAASFVYSITFQYGGTYGGKGKYLTGVRVAARDIKVNWGFDLDASSQLIQISNVGTTQNVIAGATIEITYTVKNVMRNLTSSVSFHVTGDGRIYKLD